MSIDQSPQGRRILIFLSGVVLVGLSIAFVDRPASTWSHAVLHGMPVFARLTHIVDPFAPAAAICLTIAGCAAAFGGWRPGKWGLTLVACALSVVVAVAIRMHSSSTLDGRGRTPGSSITPRGLPMGPTVSISSTAARVGLLFRRAI